MTSDEDFFSKLLRDLESHPTLRHPFLRRFARGITREELCRYAAQHYAYSCQFICNVAAVMSNTRDEMARRLLALNIYEEIGEPLRIRDRAHLLLLEAGAVDGHTLGRVLGEIASQGDVDVVAALIERGVVTRERVAEIVEAGARVHAQLTHPALFRRFLHAIGLEPASVPDPLPATMAFIAEARRICADETWLTGLGALGPGTECVVPRLYGYVLAGIETAKLLAPADYVFWTIHVHCDEAHGRNIVDAMRPHATTDATQELIRAGALRMLDARHAWLDALEGHVFGSPGAA